jgi:hypothetical protein
MVNSTDMLPSAGMVFHVRTPMLDGQTTSLSSDKSGFFSFYCFSLRPTEEKGLIEAVDCHILDYVQDPEYVVPVWYRRSLPNLRFRLTDKDGLALKNLVIREEILRSWLYVSEKEARAQLEEAKESPYAQVVSDFARVIQERISQGGDAGEGV